MSIQISTEVYKQKNIVKYNGVMCDFLKVENGYELTPMRFTDDIGNGCGYGITVDKFPEQIISDHFRKG